VEVFGFHLATVDLRQSSDKHEAVVAELLAVARIEPDYASLDEDAKREPAAAPAERRAAAARDGRRPTAPHPRANWRSSRPRQGMLRALRPQAIRHYIISHTETVSDLLEVLLLQKEVGLMRGTLDDAAPPGPT
jgi:phosphoenolpyruvate carboxylase